MAFPLLLLAATAGQLVGVGLAASPYAWECDSAEQICTRTIEAEITATPLDIMECKMTCTDHGLLWPLPTGDITLSKGLSFFQSETDVALGSFSASSTNEFMVTKFFDEVFIPSLSVMKNEFKEHRQIDLVNGVVVDVTIDDEFTSLRLGLDESYMISLADEGDTIRVTVSAVTYYGARHALETLSQLISYNQRQAAFQIHSSAAITDAPGYPYRGVMVDTSRNFMPVDVLKRILDGMSASKLNVFHWHITDSQSFPLCLPGVPQACEYGAYSEKETYSYDDAVDLLNYALLRGIMIVPELDTPQHAANGWQFGPSLGLGDLALCVNLHEDRCRGGVCGILNPVNPNTYAVLGQVYADLASVFTADLFHMGGDEVKFDCWMASDEVQQWLADHGLSGTQEDYFDLWLMFQQSAFEELTVASAGFPKKAVIWTSSLTDQGGVIAGSISPENYTIQSWSSSTDPVNAELINAGFDMIYSPGDKYYLDCGTGSWAALNDTLPCEPYNQWREIYVFDPRSNYLSFPNSEAQRAQDQILGGAVTAFSETIGAATLEGRVFPRAAALAERLWTEPAEDWIPAEIRFVNHRERLVERGIGSAAANMHWCHQYEGQCRLK